MLKSICTVIIFLSGLFCYAQHTVSGTVLNNNSEPLPGASVKLTGSKVTTSDSSGKFEFRDVSAGNYEITISYVGFEEKVTPVNVQENTEVTIRMNQALIITDEVVVSATRATSKTPTTFTTINKEAIRQQNFGQDVPFLLNWTPSVVTTSDAGTGIGYTGIRIRGSDATRINVTINGIPYNDSESLGTFWVNISDIASSSQSIQVQRGVGTSTNGAAAFGASINMQTTTRNDLPYAELVNSFGSFDTRRHTFGFGTGLLNNHWVIDGRISRIASDGFIDRAFSDLKSYYFSAGFFTRRSMLKAITFGGRERTYQSWYGVPESRLNNDLEAMEMTVANEGWNDTQREHLLTSAARTYNPYTYPNQVDNYQQDHYQLHFSHQLSNVLTWNTALHYTPGKGYYEEYRYDADFEDYGVDPVVIGDSTISTADLVRRRWLRNDFYGFTWSLNADTDLVNLVWGGGFNRYDGDHFGEILWSEVSPVPTEYRYYFNNGDKRDFNTFLKTNYNITQKLNAFVDLQFRRITYQANGVENNLNDIAVDADFNFFNPKIGATYALNDRNQLYASFAIAHREPVRDDFVDFPGNTPKPEQLRNLEAGFRKDGDNHMFHANLYLMDYKNQLVLTGQINDVGASVRTNAGESSRAGIELEGTVNPVKNVQWNLNLNLSDNRIKSFTEVLEDYGDNFDEFNIIENTYQDTHISFSPAVVAGSQLSFHPFKGADLSLLTKYVGRQYLDNTSNEARSLDPYLINDVRLSYTWQPKLVKSVVFSFLVNNILDVEYESNGYTWGYLGGSTQYRENYYFPQAGRNFMAMVAIRI